MCFMVDAQGSFGQVEKKHFLNCHYIGNSTYCDVLFRYLLTNDKCNMQVF